MPRRPSADSAAPLLDLHPVLQSTLQCMDVSLDDELARYRRARRRSPVQSRWGEGQPIMPPVVDPAEPMTAAPSTAALAIAPHLAADLEPEPPFPAAGMDSFDEDPLGAAEPEGYPDYLESSEHLLRSLTDDEAELRGEAAPRMLDTLLTPLGVGSMVLLLLSSVTLGYVITNPNGLPFMTADAPAEDPTADLAPGDPSAVPGEGDGSSFYPDLSSQEFRDLNLDTLSTLPDEEVGVTPGTASPTPAAPRPVAQPSPRLESAPVATAPATPTPAAQPAPSSRPAAPTASPSRSPAATASRPAPSPSRPAASAPSPAPSPRPAAQPSPSPRPTTPSPASTPVAAAPTTPATYFYVVADYTGDRSLDSAREAVGDAYVRNFEIGAVIQFGAFSEESRAAALRQELQSQGISARIYQAESN